MIPEPYKAIVSALCRKNNEDYYVMEHLFTSLFKKMWCNILYSLYT